jgi:DNA-binding XRE family transcriptional regulator
MSALKRKRNKMLGSYPFFGKKCSNALYYPCMLNPQDEKTRQDIASKLKKYRLKKGMKQTDVAEKAGLNSNFYSKVERGEAIPSVITLKKILGALGVKSSEVLSF